jgi:hypothetical protein
MPEPGGPQRVNMTREAALRVMASENRFERRVFGRQLVELVGRTRDVPVMEPRVRVGFIRQRPQTAYVFLVLRPDRGRPREEYEQRAGAVLMAYCRILAVELPEVRQIVGISMAPPGDTPSMEALCFMRTDELTEESRAEARQLQAQLNFLVNFRERMQVRREQEYPDEEA